MTTSPRRVYVAGHTGMVGSAIVRRLQSESEVEILTATHADLDLTSQNRVAEWLADHSVDEMHIAAAKVGGIDANDTFPADFIYDNLMIEANLIHAAHRTGIQKLLFLGSSCIYPKHAEQPMAEDALLTGPLELTNEPYAIAKIAGIKLCESYNRQHGRDYRSAMPTNLYGPGDNFHPQHSHVIPGLMRRFHEAVAQESEEVVIWGTGTPRREFLHVDDLTAAAVHLMNLDEEAYWNVAHPRLSHINVGTGTDVTIRELAETIARVVGFTGKLVFDSSKPDGTPRKLLDISRIRALGWEPTIGLEHGLRDTYQWFLEQGEHARG